MNRVGASPTADCCIPDSPLATDVKSEGLRHAGGLGGTWGHETPRPRTPGRFVVEDWGVSTRNELRARRTSLPGNEGWLLRSESEPRPPLAGRLCAAFDDFD